MNMRHSWNADRAIGFVIGIGCTMMMGGVLVTGSPWPVAGFFALMGLGVFMPLAPHKR